MMERNYCIFKFRKLYYNFVNVGNENNVIMFLNEKIIAQKYYQIIGGFYV